MELVRHPGVDAFRRRADAFLVAHEAENNLLLGLSASLRESPGLYTEAPYLATVGADGAVVAVALRTPPHNLVLSAAPAEAIELIARDVERAGGTPGVLGPSADARAFARAWSALTGAAPGAVVAERIYQLDAVVPVTGVAGSLERATVADRDLLVDWLERFTIEALGPADRASLERTVDIRLASGVAGYFLWRVDGDPTCLAACSGPTPSGIRIGPVYTPPALRRKGYGSACVAALSQRCLDGGRRLCFLFTDLANSTSNSIYQAIGYRPVCDFEQIELVPPRT
jgi:predicted GNAT family acetyltransferase